MLQIIARNISMEFPVYDVRGRSLRHALVIDRIVKRAPQKTLDIVGGEIICNERGQVVVKALNDLSFEINEGDRVGLLGHNGAGKTTLLRTLSGIFEPLHGELTVSGRVTPMFNLMDGVDMDSTGFEAIRSRAILLGLSQAEIAERTNDIAEFTELGDYLSMPVRTYSTGMMVRLSFAAATAIRPEILLMDEIIGAGDAYFIEKAQARLSEYLDTAGIIVIATHSMDIIRQMCNKAILLHKGHIIDIGEVEQVIESYDRALHSEN